MTAIHEIFWTTSAYGMIRGLHFQEPPSSIGKLVWVSHGEILDVVVDLRIGESFGTVESYQLDSNSGQTLWVPHGFAHGFQALSEQAIVNYAVDGGFDPVADAGVRWDSIELNWPIPPTEISVRDQALPPLAEFESPF
jgi:dTDP-4-dehydrorhamnose 3,5-epimerase